MKAVFVCLSKAQIELMSWPVYLTGEVPCVFAWLSSYLRGQEVPPFPYIPGICERTKLIVLVNLIGFKFYKFPLNKYVFLFIFYYFYSSHSMEGNPNIFRRYVYRAVMEHI